MSVVGGRDIGVFVWLLLGVVIATLIALALYSYIGALVFAVFLYYATRPLYRRLNEFIDHPNITVTLTVLIVVLPMLVVVGYAVLTALQELNQFLATHSLEGIRSYLQPYLTLVREGRLERLWDMLVTSPGQPLSPAVQRAIERVFGRITTIAGLVFAVLSRLFLTSIFLFYLLRDDHKIGTWFYESIDADDQVVEFISEVNNDLETVFLSNLAIIAIAGGLAAVAYYVLNVIAPAGEIVTVPVLLGLLTGIATLVPIVGMKIVYIPYTAYLVGLAVATDTPFWHPVAFFVVTLVVVDTIPDFFIRSFLSARSGVHMGLVLLGYVLGAMAFGWYGLFLGPLVVVVAVHFAHSIVPRLAMRLS